MVEILPYWFLGTLMIFNLGMGIFDYSKGKPFDFYAIPQDARIVKSAERALFALAILAGLDHWLTRLLPNAAFISLFYLLLLTDNSVSALYRVRRMLY